MLYAFRLPRDIYFTRAELERTAMALTVVDSPDCLVLEALEVLRTAEDCGPYEEILTDIETISTSLEKFGNCGMLYAPIGLFLTVISRIVQERNN
jgi:hypothetical protein